MAAAAWQVDTMDGFLFKQCRFSDSNLIFCSAQQMYVIEIPPNSSRRLSFVCDSLPAVVSDFAMRDNALAAINGSFFDMQSGFPICYLRIDGREVGENTRALTDSINRKYYQYATVTLNDGHVGFVVPDSNRLWEGGLAVDNIMTAGPMLLLNGIMTAQRDDRTFVTNRHNRTALGTREDGTTILFVVDGRFNGLSEGLSLTELQYVMRWLGCRDAVNLDGGGSTTMYVKGFPDDGVVNHPSDNKEYDHDGQRPVSNAILVR